MRIDAVGFNVDTSVVTNRTKVNVDKIRKRVVSTLSRRIKVQARRDIQTEYNLKASTINDRLSVSHRFFDVRLKARAAGLNLINFSARQTKTGVSYAVKKGQRKTLSHAFIRRTKKGDGPFVWMRGEGHDRRHAVKSFAFGLAGRYTVTKIRGRNSLYNDEHGYPIFQQYGPSVAQMLKHGDRPQHLADYASDVVAAELARLTR